MPAWMAPLATVAGGLLGLAGSKVQADATNKANENAGLPRWDPRQEALLFGGGAWNPQIPQVNADAMNYGRSLMGGYNPTTGPQGPMDFESILGGLLGGPQSGQQNAGIYGLLGYGSEGQSAQIPPPMMVSNPYYGGAGVDDPGRFNFEMTNPGYQVPNQPLQAAPQQSMLQPQPTAQQRWDQAQSDYRNSGMSRADFHGMFT